ncbi:ATP-binding protein [Streptomyces sp. NPDC058045]|uniref:ATP-binding protein n=1 Tax=Streptomyces sp. NPDC058045 TaxID=3346311 RepID=UPI0036EBFB28
MTAPVNCYYVVEVEASGERLRHIRGTLAAHLGYWGLELHTEPVCRGVRELFLNVAEHAGESKTCVIELRWNGRFVTAAVSDRDRALPLPLGPARGGLSRVAALSDTWGACPRSDGKIVWFTRRATAAQREPLAWPLPDPGAREALRTPVAVPC